MAYLGNCSENIGATNVNKVCVQWSNISRFWRAAPGFYFASKADAEDIDKVYEAIQNELLWPMPILDSVEVEDEDTQRDEQPLGTAFVRTGKKKWKTKFFSNPHKDKFIRTHDQSAGGWFQVDALGGFRGVDNPNGDDGSLYPCPYQLFTVEKPEENNGSDSAFKSVISIDMNDSQVQTYLKSASIVEGSDISWSALDVDGLTPVTLTVQSASATTIVVSVTVGGTTIPITGLSTVVSEDFIVKTAAGVEIVPSLINESSPGVYTLTVVGLVTNDTIALTSPSVMTTNLQTTGVGYKGDNPLAMTVV